MMLLRLVSVASTVFVKSLQLASRHLVSGGVTTISQYRYRSVFSPLTPHLTTPSSQSKTQEATTQARPLGATALLAPTVRRHQHARQDFGRHMASVAPGASTVHPNPHNTPGIYTRNP